MSKQVAIVVGASSGIGECIARQLSAEGWHVALLARRDRMLPGHSGQHAAGCEVTEITSGRLCRIDIPLDAQNPPTRDGWEDSWALPRLDSNQQPFD